MDEQLDISCPICAYQFSTPDKLPKLLPCYHTICSPCVDNIIASTPLNSDSTIKCPICRQGASIPKNGVEGFFDNYFRSAPQQEETCDICGTQDNRKLEHCNECYSLLCVSCHNSHHHQKTLKDGKIDEVEDGEESEDDNHIDSSFMRETEKAYLNSVRTAFFGFHSTTFKCNNFESIRKILPSEENECWVLTNRPFVSRFSRSGKETYRKYVENVPQDIARSSDGSLVLAFPDRKIMLLNGHDLKNVTVTENIPSAVYVYQDGRLLIATRPHPRNSHLRNSELLMTDQSMKKPHPLDVDVDLREVSSITVNERNGQMALCETSKKCVYLVRHCRKMHRGQNVKKYSGTRDLSRIEQTEDRISFMGNSFFQPRSVASDQNDNFFVLDAGTNLIHVLNEKADLQAVVLAEIPGNIYSFNVDLYENLWTGDMSGQIRVFRMELRNFLGENKRGDGSSGVRMHAGLFGDGGSGIGSVSLEDLSSMGLHRFDGLSGLLRSSTSEQPVRMTDNFTRNIF